MATTLKERVDKRLTALGISPFEAERRAGFSKNFVYDIVIGRKKSVRPDKAAALALALETTEAFILGLESGPPDTPVSNRFEPMPAVVSQPPAPRDIPIYGTANGLAIGAFNFEGGAVDYARRPPGLAGARDAYAIFVSGESMVPEHRPGDVRFVHPHKPVRIGDTVIIQARTNESSPIEGYIKILTRMTEKTVFVTQHNPAATLEFPRQFVKSIHKVMTQNELFGL